MKRPIPAIWGYGNERWEGEIRAQVVAEETMYDQEDDGIKLSFRGGGNPGILLLFP